MDEFLEVKDYTSQYLIADSPNHHKKGIESDKPINHQVSNSKGSNIKETNEADYGLNSFDIPTFSYVSEKEVDSNQIDEEATETGDPTYKKGKG